MRKSVVVDVAITRAGRRGRRPLHGIDAAFVGAAPKPFVPYAMECVCVGAHLCVRPIVSESKRRRANT